MAFPIADVVTYVQGLLKDSALFKTVLIGRPNQSPGTGPAAAVFVDSMRVVEATLGTAIEVYTVKVRIYRAQYVLGSEQHELQSLALVAAVADLLYGNFALDGSPRNIDLAAQYGVPFEVQWVEESEMEAAYHLADITLPLIADNTTEIGG